MSKGQNVARVEVNFHQPASEIVAVAVSATALPVPPLSIGYHTYHSGMPFVPTLSFSSTDLSTLSTHFGLHKDLLRFSITLENFC